MRTSISVVAFRDPVRDYERAAAAPRRLSAVNVNEARAGYVAAFAAEPELRDAYRWSDPRPRRSLSWQAWAGTIALHGLLGLVIAAAAWTSRLVPPTLPEAITVVFESPAAPSPQPTAQPERPPPALPAHPRAETTLPVARTAPPRAPAVVTAPDAPALIAVLPPPPPPRPILREAAPQLSPPLPTTRPAPVAPSPSAPVPSHSAPVPAATVAFVPVIPPRPASGVAGNRKPLYPLAARNQRWEGRVMLQVDVAASGEPVSVRVVSSSGHALLDDSALAAVRSWHFVPASQGGRPVPGTVDVPVDFRMVD